MNDDFLAAMRQAAQSLRGQNIQEATRVIQVALARKLTDGAASGRGSAKSDLKPERGSLLQSPETERKGESPDKISAARAEAQMLGAGVDPQPEPRRRARRSLADVLRALRKGRQLAESPFGASPDKLSLKKPKLVAAPEGAKFLWRSFSCAGGSRDYRLYVAASSKGRPQALVIMLHGCKQDPDDFALGTKMNAIAEAHRLVVAYPAQHPAANPSRCWNWFDPRHQGRGAGEPSIIAGITRALASEFGINQGRTFIAGLSAGAAMAAVMVETYPELYAAAGIHSGLAYGSANDVVSAFAAMRGDFGSSTATTVLEKPRIRTIVFHGGADRTVDPSNADRIVAGAMRQFPSGEERHLRRVVNGRESTRIVVTGDDGVPAVEFWLTDEAAHAWSGGDPQGSFVDPRGPDASAEMMRFFLAGPTETRGLAARALAETFR